MNYQREYEALIANARSIKTNLNGEVHHIIPRSIHRNMPSTVPVNAPENLVFLSHQMHLKAHWLLFKIYEGHEVWGPPMAIAYTMMVQFSKKRAEPTAEMLSAYASAKVVASEQRSKFMYGKKFSEETKSLMSKSNSGKRNSNYGKTGALNHSSKAVKNTVTGEVWGSAAECGRKLGVPGATITRRIRRKFFGGIWQYA